MKKILFASLVFFITGCASYWHDGTRDDKRSSHHEEHRGTGHDREHPTYR
ncbi:MAG: hypothetical protein HGB26_07725 [Desulfobulbaceae bacterium]|nr:hypothetical protein [Desulfobulbaceae bacterium]